MSEPRQLRCAEPIERAYEGVRDLLHREPLRLLQRATTSAVDRSNSRTASLRLHVGGVAVGVQVRVHVRRVRDNPPGSDRLPVTCVELAWDATNLPTLFPSMLAELFARPLSEHETQLEIVGSYWPPLGPIGHAIDVAVGHGVAESAVCLLLADLAAQLLDELP
jgi:hypothetical protein